MTDETPRDLPAEVTALSDRVKAIETAPHSAASTAMPDDCVVLLAQFRALRDAYFFHDPIMAAIALADAGKTAPVTGTPGAPPAPVAG